MAGHPRERALRGRRRRVGPAFLALVGLTATLWVVTMPSAEAAAPSLLRSFGDLALQDGDLREPADVGVGPDGLVYVADFEGDAVIVFDRDGVFQRRWSVTDPAAIAVAPTSGHAYTVTSSTCTISEFDGTGTPVRTFGICGSGTGQLSAPGAVTVAPDGSVYVADTGHDKVQQFSATGTHVRTWGGNGTTDGKFREPTAIAVGIDGTVVVADRVRDDIQAFTADGVFVRKWGAAGTGDGQFVDPTGIAVAPDGSVAAVDRGDTSRPPSVQRFAPDGTYLVRWGAAGSDAGELDTPLGVAVAADGAVFVADSQNQRVQRFTPAGASSVRWGSFETTQRVRSPRGVSVDADERVLVADDGAERVQVFAPDGALAATWATTDGPGGALLDPWDTAIDGTGRVLVVDRGHDRIQRYLADGTPDGGWGTTGTGDGQFSDPIGIAVAPDGDVLVSDAAARRVQQFHPDGTFVRAWNTIDSAGATFAPGGLDLDAAGNVYVANTTANRVAVRTATGAYLREWASSNVRSLTVDRDHGVVYATSCSANRVRRTDLSGGAGLNLPTSGCATDVTIRGDDYFVAEQPAFPGARVAQYAYPAGGGVDITLTAASSGGTVGTPVQYQLTLVNTGSATLTGLATTSAQLADCARSLPDLPPRATVVVDCSYVPVPADVGAFSATVAVDSDQTDPLSATPVSVQVNGSMTAPTLREWRPSPTSLADGDPVGGTSLATTPALDVDGDGDVFVAGTRTYPAAALVQRFDSDATFEDDFGAVGTGPGELGRPSRLAVGPSGEVYVADCDNDRLQRFSASGTFDHAWTEERTPSSRETCSPADVAVAPDGTAYVADAANDRIAVIEGDTLSPGWGTTGTGDGQFNTPNGVAVAPDGTVYVLDGGNRRVQHFTAEGGFLGSFGSGGFLLGQFGEPKAIDVDEDGTVYVADRGPTNATRRTQVFDGDGRLLVSLPIVTPELSVHVDDGGSAHLYTYPYSNASSGSILGVVREYVIAGGPVAGVTFTTPTPQVTVGATAELTVRIDNFGTVALTGVSVDTGGVTGCTTAVDDIAVGTHRTVTCSSSTTTLDHVGRHHLRATVDTDQTPTTRSVPLAVQVLRPTVAHFGGLGSGEGQLDSPRGMAVNWRGDLYVADCGNDRLVHYETNGQFVRDRLTGECPTDVALAPSGNILVLLEEGVVQEFLPDGSFLRWWSTGTTDPGTALAIDVDEAGNIYVADAESIWVTWEDYFDGWGYTCCIAVDHPPRGNNLVRRFAPDGTFLGQWGGYPGRYQLAGMWIDDGTVNLVDRNGVSLTGLDGTQEARLPELSGGVDDVAVDRFGHVWVTGGDRVRELTSAGNVLAEYPIVDADGITVDRDDVYVTNGDRVTKIGIGTPLTALAGTVREVGSGTPPVAGAFVVALRASDLTFVRGALTDADGFYRMEVPAGTYLLEFYDPAGRHRFEWYDNQPTPASLDDVTRVTVAPSEERTANATLNPTTGGFGGRVTRAGTLPDDGIHVIALRNGSPAGMATTDSTGDYQIRGLLPGVYTLVFVDPTGRTAPEFYDDAAVPSGARAITVRGTGDSYAVSADLAVVVTPPPSAGTATGTITDETTGEPVPGALVVAMRSSDLGFVQAATTGPDGGYTLPLPAGEHFLQVVDATGRHVMEWFDDQTNPSTFASLTTVHAGSTASASVHATVGRIRGVVTEDGTGTPIEGAWVVAFGAGGAIGATTTSDGHYALDGLAPGTYSIVAVDPSGDHRPEYHEDRPGPDGAAVLPVSAGASVTVAIDLDPT